MARSISPEEKIRNLRQKVSDLEVSRAEISEELFRRLNDLREAVAPFVAMQQVMEGDDDDRIVLWYHSPNDEPDRVLRAGDFRQLAFSLRETWDSDAAEEKSYARDAGGDEAAPAV